jgi:hypothetical protein
MIGVIVNTIVVTIKWRKSDQNQLEEIVYINLTDNEIVRDICVYTNK